MCSRSCGGGIRIKRRICQQGPSKDGCNGEPIQAQLCNIQPCPIDAGEYEFKGQQCASTNTKADHLGRYRNWVPYDKVESRLQCRVVCIPDKSRDEKAEVRKDTAIDGTMCEHDVPYWGYDKCVDGKCKKFGCDGKLSSGLYFDKCGVCGGTGNTCKKVSGNHTSGKYPEHLPFLVLRGGTTSIKIISSNVYTHIGIRVNGRWVLGPHSGRGTSRLYDSDGVHVHYKSDKIDSDEQLVIKSIPYNTTVVISVQQDYDSALYSGVDPVITYEYYLPNTPGQPVAVGSVQRYKWSLIGTSGCTQTCGGGMQLVIPTCVIASDDSPVDDVLCDLKDKPASTPIPCNSHACPASWAPLDIKQCSRSCQTNQIVCPVTCVRYMAGTPWPLRVSNDQCPNVPGSNYVVSCQYKWITGHWSQCPAPCGYTASQTRQVLCVSVKDNEISQYGCQPSLRPSSSRQCNGNCVKQTFFG